MRVMIVSDTHRKHKNLEIALQRVAPIDRLIHLGDAEGYEDYIEELAGCPIDIVAGNNDFFSALPKEKIITIENHQILITHGHYYYVSAGISDIKKEAKAKGVEIVMFGHTHRPVIDYDDDIIALNPGSLSYPRQEGRQPSFIMMEIDRKGKLHFDIQYLNVF